MLLRWFTRHKIVTALVQKKKLSLPWDLDHSLRSIHRASMQIMGICVTYPRVKAAVGSLSIAPLLF